MFSSTCITCFQFSSPRQVLKVMNRHYEQYLHYLKVFYISSKTNTYASHDTSTILRPLASTPRPLITSRRPVLSCHVFGVVRRGEGGLQERDYLRKRLERAGGRLVTHISNTAPAKFAHSKMCAIYAGMLTASLDAEPLLQVFGRYFVLTQAS